MPPKVATTRDQAQEQGKDNQRAVSKFIRQSRNPEMYIGLTDDLINMSALRPNPEIEARFKEVFDRDQRENLRIVLHPLLKRWTIFERTWHRGQPLWQTVCMFHDTPKDDYLPPDLQRDDRMLDHLKGYIGNFRNVSYQDLEFVEKCDFRKYGWERVDEFLAAFDDEKQKEEERVMYDRLDDFLSYNFWLAMRDAQAHYSQPWSTRSVELKSDPAHYKIEQRDGYKVRTRVYGNEGDVNEMKAFMEGAARFDDSASGKAAIRMMEIKNERYYKVHGITLCEAVLGKTESALGGVEDGIAYDKENKNQTEQLVQFLGGLDLDNVESQKLEDWLLALSDEQKDAFREMVEAESVE